MPRPAVTSLLSDWSSASSAKHTRDTTDGTNGATKTYSQRKRPSLRPAYSLDSGGEPELIVAVVENGVVLAEEDIAKDPQRAARCWDIETREAKEALRHTALGDLEYVVRALELELLAADREGERGFYITEKGYVSSIISDGYHGTLDGTNQNDSLYGVMKRKYAAAERGESEAEALKRIHGLCRKPKIFV